MKPFTTIAAAIFALMALVHAYRLVAGFPVHVGDTEIAQGISWIALAVTALLSFGLFREARR
jgi:ABC-type transport system involved in cytochrome c biogenesis permease component